MVPMIQKEPSSILLINFYFCNHKTSQGNERHFSGKRTQDPVADKTEALGQQDAQAGLFRIFPKREKSRQDTDAFSFRLCLFRLLYATMAWKCRAKSRCRTCLSALRGRHPYPLQHGSAQFRPARFGSKDIRRNRLVLHQKPFEDEAGSIVSGKILEKSHLGRKKRSNGYAPHDDHHARRVGPLRAVS